MSFLPVYIPSQLFPYSVGSENKRTNMGFDVSKLYPHFSELELITMQKAWAIIEPKIHKLSHEILMDLYLTNFEAIEKFRDKNGKISNYDLIKHTYRLLQIYSAIIKCNVHKFETSKILESFIKLQAKRSVNMGNMKLQLDYITKHMFAELNNLISPTIIGSFSKLNEFMLHYFRIRAGVQ